ncbi:23S rRNA (uracil(1939)-C(5))-methyltransferase RlmD [Paenactinomyces guangxiensis]|uniref:23S rRNA (Uracil(1939)-C(5))-methyltransferase RlmD n=1 Tax=Paenactinomyces guangxiensis TaxID=1490290 RepID=A0A7W1WT24_9BACL|nr:23S rRNA (uracil(1939)-C(5))-methyltransferase RlmD [Paenactinomyces guangxiensis]MBA4495540.1 23S rRNA (uracil(1939)-C(5))-methyltransferase RlmD [Paenactinomyces guangxiensis]MBH8592798.1 23S rRNA (uracil(1939)-C(5))-methyltransferase RlmD [Paenactinomyces guangxiensis]
MKQKPPVQPGQVIEYEITGQGHSGTGVGRFKGFTVFVPQAVPGEKVRARMTQVKKNYGQAELLQVLKPHPDRTDPLCPVFAECGGCQSQHLSYETQLRLKRQQVIASFERIGGLQHITIHPVIGMKVPWRYRNKAQIPFGQEDGRVIAGFYRPGSHQIIDMDACLIQHPENDRVVAAVKQLANELNIPAYDEQKHQGVLRHVMVRIGVQTNELMVVLVTNGDYLPHQKTLLEQLRSQFPNLKSIVQNINRKRTNVILGPDNRLLWGSPVIYDMIGSIRFSISPHSFFQVNPSQTKVLYDQVRKYAALTGTETVVDAYCGIGTIALYLAQDAKQVYGVEIVPQAIEDARYNAELNGMKHVRFEAGAAEQVMPRWLKEGIKPDVIVVDPPRKGCDPALLDAVVGMLPDRLVYVSCNPATLARDAKLLAEKGYATVEVQPVDMFPQTGHVECVAKIILKS